MLLNSFLRETSSGHIFQNLRYVKFRLKTSNMIFLTTNVSLLNATSIALFNILYPRIRSFIPEHY